MCASYPCSSLFALLSFVGLYLCSRIALEDTQVDGERACSAFRRFVYLAPLLLAAAIAFALAGALRSNGALLASFLIYAVACELRRVGRPVGVSVWLCWLAVTAVSVAVVFVPYVAFQYYGYFLYCAAAPASLRAWAAAVSLSLPTHPLHPTRPWCGAAGGSSAVPLMYGFVQAEYWGVGPLHYFQAKQIPQFALAAPMLVLAGLCAWRAFGTQRRVAAAAAEIAGLLLALVGPLDTCAWSERLQQMLLASPGVGGTRALFLMPSSDPPAARAPSPHARRRGSSAAQQSLRHSPADSPIKALARSGPACDPTSAAALPYVLYWVGLVAVGVVLMHVQVVTRFVAGSPALYWFLAQLWAEARVSETTLRRSGARTSVCDARSLTLGYALGYTFVGATLFSCFYNWT